MTAVNTALSVDLTGQATAESIGYSFYSGIGGLADFMRGAILFARGRTILTLPSTAEKGKVSRIVPLLPDGTGVTLGRGDVHYVVTEYGIAYLAGKNIRERAMELIAVAHPDFRPWLIDEARRHYLIYSDQVFIPGKAGRIPRAPGALADDGDGPDGALSARQDQRRAAPEGLFLRAFAGVPLQALLLPAPGHAPRDTPAVCRHRLYHGDDRPCHDHARRKGDRHRDGPVQDYRKDADGRGRDGRSGTDIRAGGSAR